MTARVWAVQSSLRRDAATGELTMRYDLSPAEKFGTLYYLTGPSATPWDAAVVREIERKLDDFTDEDYLLLVGSPVLIGVAFAAAADANEGRVATLQWSGKDGQYVPIRVVLASFTADA